MDLFHFLTDVEALVRWGGYFSLSLIVFTETGLMIGFFLPGDSLLVTAGLFAAQGHLNILVLNLVLVTVAIAGDATGYFIGRSIGPRLFERPSTRLFRREHLIRTRLYYEIHGGKTIVIARFVPVLRTFAPVVAGIARMDYRRFAFFNTAGAIGWVTSMTLIGYGLGRLVPRIDHFVELVILAVIVLSMIPVVINLWSASRRSRLRRRSFDHSIRSILHALREVRLDWTSEGLEQASQLLTAIHDASAILQSGAPPLDLRVITRDGQRSPRLEIDTSPLEIPREGGDAARELMSIELRKLYLDTVRIAADVFGTRHVTSDPASFEIENGRLRILRLDKPASGPLRLSFVLEPLELDPTEVAAQC